MAHNLGLKVYLLIFSIFAISGLLSISTPEGLTYKYYNILLSLHAPSGKWYTLAILHAILSCMVIIPLYRQAFNLSCQWKNLFQWIFMFRLGTVFMGNNYECLMIKSSFKGEPHLLGFITLGVWVLFLYPSYKEHFIYAFHSK